MVWLRGYFVDHGMPQLGTVRSRNFSCLVRAVEKHIRPLLMEEEVAMTDFQ